MAGLLGAAPDLPRARLRNRQQPHPGGRGHHAPAHGHGHHTPAHGHHSKPGHKPGTHFSGGGDFEVNLAELNEAAESVAKNAKNIRGFTNDITARLLAVERTWVTPAGWTFADLQRAVTEAGRRLAIDPGGVVEQTGILRVGLHGGLRVGDGLADLAPLDVRQGAPAQGAPVPGFESQRRIEVAHGGRGGPTEQVGPSPVAG